MTTTAERAAKIRTQLKEMYPDCKFSVVKNYVSSIDICIMVAPEKYNLKEHAGKAFSNAFPQDYTIESYAMMCRILNMAYEDVNFYETADYGNQPDTHIWLKIGKWDKEFKTSEEIAEAKKSSAVFA